MQKDKFDRVISFLQGASWAVVFFGALITFKTFIILGLSLSLFITILFILVSLFMILALDAFAVNRRKLQEMVKQTELLEMLVKREKGEVELEN